jgi:hypothetical protein
MCTFCYFSIHSHVCSPAVYPTRKICHCSVHAV